MNREWHAAHPMPPRARLEQRLAWHLAHATACGCRAIPRSLLEELERRGQKLPPHHADKSSFTA